LHIKRQKPRHKQKIERDYLTLCKRYTCITQTETKRIIHITTIQRNLAAKKTIHHLFVESPNFVPIHHVNCAGRTLKKHQSVRNTTTAIIAVALDRYVNMT